MHDDAIWRALGDPTRRSILDQLAQGPRTTGSLAEGFPSLSRFAIMKHLGTLEEAHLITWRKLGRERWNSLNAVPLRQLYERWVSHLEDGQAASLTRLAHLAETSAGTDSSGETHMSEIRSFDITSEITVKADTETTWSILTTRMGEWAKPPFRAFDEGDNIEIDLRPGGLMVETAADGRTTVWGAVTSLVPGTSVQLSGHCLMEFAWGTFTFSVSPADAGSIVSIHHIAIGPMSEGQGGGYKAGWDALLGDLKSLAES